MARDNPQRYVVNMAKRLGDGYVPGERTMIKVKRLRTAERHDTTSFDALMAGIYCLALIGDKRFDAGWLRERVRARHGGRRSAPRGDQRIRRA
jgi:hypothetical protein